MYRFYSSFEPLDTFHWVKTASFQLAAMDTSRVRGVTDDSMNSERARKQFLGELSRWDYPMETSQEAKACTNVPAYTGASPGMSWIQRISMVGGCKQSRIFHPGLISLLPLPDRISPP